MLVALQAIQLCKPDMYVVPALESDAACASALQPSQVRETQWTRQVCKQRKQQV